MRGVKLMYDFRKREQEKMRGIYYVYVYITKRTATILLNGKFKLAIKAGTPFYVGKGKLSRIIDDYNRTSNTKEFVDVFGIEIVIKEFKLTAEEAEKRERELIEKYALVEKHILTNLKMYEIEEALKHRNIPIDFKNMRGHYANRFRFTRLKDNKPKTSRR